MTLIYFTSQKGAPGTTLSTLAIAAAWPTPTGRRKLFVEADPSGGSVALRYGLGLEPGLVTLAVAIRSGAHGAAVWDHAQELPGGLAAVVGPDSADRSGAALAAVGPSLGRWLAQLGDVDVFVDLGRLDTDTHMGCLAAADLTLMVARPCVEQLQPAAHAMAALPVEADRVAWLLIGERPHSAVEVADAFAWDVAGVIAHDRRSATDLETGSGGRRLRRSALVRSATTVAESLAERFAPAPPEPEPAGGGTLAALVSQHATGVNGADHDG